MNVRRFSDPTALETQAGFGKCFGPIRRFGV